MNYTVKNTSLQLATQALTQLCPTRGPVEGFVRPSLGFHCNRSDYTLTTCPYFDNLNLTFLM